MTAKQRATQMLGVIHDAPAKAPWFALPIGALTLAAAGYRIYSAGVPTKFDYALIVGGLCALPGFMPYLTRNASSLLALYRNYKREPSDTEGESGTAGPSSGPNSPPSAP